METIPESSLVLATGPESPNLLARDSDFRRTADREVT